jgi:hypothetical protein
MTDASQLSLFPQKRRRKKRPPPPERRTHIAVVDLLRRAAKPGWIFLHIPNGEYRDDQTAQLLKRMGVLSGAYDILLIGPTGRHYWLELKRGNAPPSAAQVWFGTELRSRNIPSAVARSFDDAVAWLKTWDVLRPLAVQ